MEKNQRKCSSCGEIIDSYSEFCVFCGAKQPVPHKKQEDTITKSTKNRNKIKTIENEAVSKKTSEIKQKVEAEKKIKEQSEIIKQLESENEENLFQATHDIALTGLLNREAFNNYIESIEALDRECFISIDANNLKEFNDNFGHSAGDDLLIVIATAIKKTFPEESSFRLGGDEFGIFLQTDDKEVVETKIKSLNSWLDSEKKVLIEEYSPDDVSISVGYSFGKDFDTVEELLEDADKKMYAAKNEYKVERERNKPLEYVNDTYNANFDGYYDDTEAYIDDLEKEITRGSIKKTILLIILVIIFIIIYEMIV